MSGVDLELTPRELLTTTRTVRKRLDLERPVEREVVEDCLRLAFQAPNGSNQQRWHWVLVDDPSTRAAMADIYRGAMDDYIAQMSAARAKGSAPAQAGGEAQQRMTESVFHLREHLHEVPVLLVPTLSGRLENASIFEQASRWASVIPGVWSFMLALRTKGMGSAWTTLHLHREAEMAELLGIPSRETQVGMFPVAYTIGTDFKPADRSASEAAIHWNHW
jgi:nitroreductase